MNMSQNVFKNNTDYCFFSSDLDENLDYNDLSLINRNITECGSMSSSFPKKFNTGRWNLRIGLFDFYQQNQELLDSLMTDGSEEK